MALASIAGTVVVAFGFKTAVQRSYPPQGLGVKLHQGLGYNKQATLLLPDGSEKNVCIQGFKGGVTGEISEKEIPSHGSFVASDPNFALDYTSPGFRLLAKLRGFEPKPHIGVFYTETPAEGLHKEPESGTDGIPLAGDKLLPDPRLRCLNIPITEKNDPSFVGAVQRMMSSISKKEEG